MRYATAWQALACSKQHKAPVVDESGRLKRCEKVLRAVDPGLVRVLKDRKDFLYEGFLSDCISRGVEGRGWANGPIYS